MYNNIKLCSGTVLNGEVMQSFGIVWRVVLFRRSKAMSRNGLVRNRDVAYRYGAES